MIMKRKEELHHKEKQSLHFTVAGGRARHRKKQLLPFEIMKLRGNVIMGAS